MATNEQLIPVPGRLHSLASEGHVAGADEIYDDDLQKLQSTINADVKVMGASGTNHSKGLVPDPGATAGTTKYLREDGTWQTPAGRDYTAGDGIDITSDVIAVDNSVARLGEDDGSALIPDIYPAVFTGTCSTAASTVAKEASINAYELVRHGAVAITFTNGISVASATLNISSKGAKALYYRGAALGADVVKAGDIVTMSYDGTNYVILSIESVPVYEHIYVAVANPTGNPMTQGWYELSNGEYVLSEDTSVDSEKTYYTQSNYYSMTI